MADSMTGYGRSEIVSDSRRYLIEIKSINNRYCDIQIRMPRVLLSLEPKMREIISKSLYRGKIDVFVTIEDLDGKNSEVSVNTKLAENYSSAITEISKLTGRVDSASSEHIARFPDVLNVKDNELTPAEVSNHLFEALTEAVEEISAMRRKEGEKLVSDLLLKISSLEEKRDLVEARAPSVPKEYKERLEARIEELLQDIPNSVFEESRKETEVAVFADKCSVDEELVRLKSHFSQLRNTLKAGGSIGKKLDFIIQETNREINTIGSKANDITITNLVVDMKSELEKIREQIQNLA